MDLRYLLDIFAIVSALSSIVFWISSKYVYNDIQGDSKEIRKEMLLLLESQSSNLLSRIEKQIQRNSGRVSACEARLEYLESIFIQDDQYLEFVKRLSCSLGNSDFV